MQLGFGPRTSGQAPRLRLLTSLSWSDNLRYWRQGFRADPRTSRPAPEGHVRNQGTGQRDAPKARMSRPSRGLSRHRPVQAIENPFTPWPPVSLLPPPTKTAQRRDCTRSSLTWCVTKIQSARDNNKPHGEAAAYNEPRLSAHAISQLMLPAPLGCSYRRHTAEQSMRRDPLLQIPQSGPSP